MGEFAKVIQKKLAQAGFAEPRLAPLGALYTAVAKASMERAAPAWEAQAPGKTACYFSAEFLVGRLLYANLLNQGLLEESAAALQQLGLEADIFEQVDDAALGNGGLGRLAACFLDSGASCGYKLDGYGIRYKYGLFCQRFEDGFQTEAPDDWQRFGDPFSVRREAERVPVHFGDGTVWAMPYDMPVIGYGGATVNTLRLWQAEAPDPFDFEAFNRQDYSGAYKRRDAAEAIHSLLYPADETEAGKQLRIKQQYFFSSASVQSILRSFKQAHGTDFARLPEAYAIQLNDTHPTVAIPEMIRLLVEGEGLNFESAFAIAQKTFAYTNHTLMAEALEQWDRNLFAATVPLVWPYVVMLQNRLRAELAEKGVDKKRWELYDIVGGGRVHMAHMAIYATHSTNGVARLHSQLLKKQALPQWHALYPERFNNKTNGVTPRRWVRLCNPGLSALLDEACGPEWIRDATLLQKLGPLAADAGVQQQFGNNKRANKEALVTMVRQRTGLVLDPASVFDIHIKRLHEYKRQLLNAFSILDIYYGIKDGELDSLPPTTFLFGAKAAAGYRRAKGIIKYINEVAALIAADKAMAGRLQVVFVPDYNVSWAERLIPAADISEQISTAGTEASGTGNMKLAMNGAVTLGTWDGANIEIVEAAGAENNYVFGARVEELAALGEAYDPMALYKKSPRLYRVVNSLIDGTVDDAGTGLFRELHTALLRGASWHRADHYYLLHDFDSYTATKRRALADTADSTAFAQKCLHNIAASGGFSSDRTIRQYAQDIWKL